MNSLWLRLCFGPVCCAILLAFGCGSPTNEDTDSSSDTPQRKVSLNILIIDDQDLGTVFSRQFSSRRNGEAALTQMTWQEFADGNYEAASKNDLLIYPSWRLGELASRDLLIPVTDDNARLEDNANRSLLVSDRNQAVSWGQHHVAMSMGQSHWVTLYRSDVLERVDAEVPQTWKEFDKLADKIAKMAAEDLPDRIAIPLQGHWASYSLMARVASAIRVPGKFSSFFAVGSMQPLIDSEPFLRSLQAWQKQVGAETEPQDPAGVLADFARGEVAVAMVPVNRQWLAVEGVDSMPATTLGPVPGWTAVFDASRDSWTDRTPGTLLSVPFAGSTGMLVSASAATDQQRNVIEVMAWMTGKQMSSILSPESPNTGMSRKVHLANSDKWLGPMISSQNAARFADYMNELNNSRRLLFSLRIPQADRYLEILDEAVRTTIMENGNAVETLSAAANQWSQLTDEIGLDTQKSAYRKSVGLKE